MRYFSILAVSLLLGLIFGASAPAQPFAPRVDVPDSMKNQDDLDAMLALNSVIPSQDEVGFPAYPGARILFTQMDNQVKENGEWVHLPKRIFMGSSDSPQQIVEFYKKNLTNWKFAEFYGVPTFYRKEGTFKPMEDMQTPRIVISPEFRKRTLMPSSKTTIDIYYDEAR